MLWQTQVLLGQTPGFDYLTGQVFFATLFLYAAHRIVGISRLKDFFEVDRYQVIASFKWHIFLYAAVAGLGAFYCFLFLGRILQWAFILPGIFSVAYVIPFLRNKRRIPD